MAYGSESNRWWENYLVRYFLPSLAGMLIVFWTARLPGAAPYAPQVLPSLWKDFGSAHLILWLLLGSLYCYLASYPALVFHATRILDFRNVEGEFFQRKYLLSNTYFSSVLFTLLAGLFAWVDSKWCPYAGVLLVILFSCLQIWRIWRVYSVLGRFGLDDLFSASRDASIAYAYLRTLSDRRSRSQEDKIVEEPSEKSTTIRDAKDFVDSYRHLREHGNTAFIVMLEIALYWVLFLVLGDEKVPPLRGQAMFSFVIVFWVLPSVFIHGLAQHLERRFSLFDFSIEDGNKQIDRSES